MKLKKRTKKFLITLSVIVGLFALALIIYLIASTRPLDTTFNIAVTTERIEWRTTDHNNSRIPMTDFEVYNLQGDSLGVFNGAFEVSKGATVVVKRVSNGPLILQVKGADQKSAGVFYSEDQDEIEDNAPNFMEFYVADPSYRNAFGETIVIPLSGEVILGRTVNYETYSSETALVRSGTVVMIGKSVLGSQFFEGGRHEMHIGDRFEVENPKSEAFGFVSVNEEPAMQAAYRVVGEGGAILTPGPRSEGSSYTIKTTLLSRFLHDPFFLGLSWATAFLILIATLLPFYGEVRRWQDRRKK